MIATIIILFVVCIALSIYCKVLYNEKEEVISLYLSEMKKNQHYEKQNF